MNASRQGPPRIAVAPRPASLWLVQSTAESGAGADLPEVVAWLQRGPVQREELLLKMLSSVPLLRGAATVQVPP